MSAIAGLVQFDGQPVDPRILERMQNVLGMYGKDSQNTWHAGGAGLVRNLRRITQEDAFDLQPLKSSDGRFLLVADARIDNREELLEELRIPARDARLMADSAFILAAFEQWGLDCPQHLLGDFAFAVWEHRARRLFLARDPMGHRPLYWYHNDRFFAFATLAKGLFALPDIPRALCEERIADYLALLPMKGAESFYKNIFRIEPGHFLMLEHCRLKTRAYHHFDLERRIILKSDNEYVEAARELLDKAVACRLRSAGGVASHLSSGLDSSTITATAARLLRQNGKSLIAFTAVPSVGFTGPVPKGRHADEGPAATALARLFPNIEHILFRSRNQTPLDKLQAKVETLDRAPLNPCNHVWIDGIQTEASQRGCRVLLTAQMGNMTISYNGLPRLASLLREGKWIEWLTEARQLACNSDIRMRGIIVRSLGPFVPIAVWRKFSALRRHRLRSVHEYSAIHPDLVFRTNLQARSSQAGWDLTYRPWIDGRRMRTAVMYRNDPGDYYTACVGNSGIEMRDPTTDLRLVAFCLAIPEDQYLKNGQPRRLLYRMMWDVLPPEILSLKTKGYQAADWYEGTSAARDEIRHWLDCLDASNEAHRFLDIRRMRKLLENWPKDGWAQYSVIQNYRLLLLRGLSVGAFIHYVERHNH